MLNNRLVIAMSFLWLSSFVHADPCHDNFSSDGTFFTATNYMTWAVLPNTSRLDAFARVHAHTVESDFTVLSSDQNTGTISAVNTASYSKGQKVPFNVSIKDENEGIRITVVYTTPAGVFSPKEAIQGQLCRTIAVAAQGNANKPATTQAGKNTSDATPPAALTAATQQSINIAPNGNADIRNGNPCLGGVCVDDDLTTLGHIKWQKASQRFFRTPIEHYKKSYDPKKHIGLFAPQSVAIIAAAGPYIDAQAFDTEGIAKLGKVKGFCQGHVALEGQFLSENGLVTNVSARVITANNGQAQSIRVVQITRYYPNETTQAQRQQLKDALMARYATVSQNVLLGSMPNRSAWKFDGTELNLYSGYSSLQEKKDAFLRYPGCSRPVSID